MRAHVPPSRQVERAGPLGVIVSPQGVRHAGHLIDLATRAGVTQLWIPRSISAALDLPDELPARWDKRTGAEHRFVTDAHQTHDLPRGLMPWLHGWSLADRAHAVDLVFAAYDDSPFAEIGRPDVLLAALGSFKRATGVEFRRSTGKTGTALLRAVHRGARSPALTSPAPLPPPARESAIEVDVAHYRPLSDAERELSFVHAYDLNGMRLAACSSLACALGEPEHRKARSLDVDPSVPGYWLASIEADLPAELFNPFNVGPAIGYRERRTQRHRWLRWYSSPTLALAHELGAEVLCVEAFTFAEHRRYLRPWYERLRDARSQLARSANDPADAAALRAVKLSTNRALGWLAGSFHDASDELFRPPWYHAVIATARANLYRRLRKVLSASAQAPFAIATDCLFYASPERDPIAAAPPELPLGAGLGQFKVAGSAPLAAIAAIPPTPRSLRLLVKAVSS